MILLQRLYTEPQYFEPIIFSEGINLIIGDRSDKSNKTNSVGKSMCIEFINYCLLKDAKYSRVTKIPENKFPLDIKIKLDFKINNKQLTIIRTRKDADNVIIISNGQELFFHSIQDASKYLQNLLFENHCYSKLRSVEIFQVRSRPVFYFSNGILGIHQYGIHTYC